MAESADPFALSDRTLLDQCEVDTYRASGPGGQHRNRTESAVRLRHRPTGIAVHAHESRSQHENRARALRRLREALALEVRSQILDLSAYQAPPALAALLGASVKPSPRNPEFWRGVSALLDVLVAVGGSLSDAARVLGVSTGAVSRVLTSHPPVHRRVNVLRADHGLRPLR